jgi:hypothetical protein
MADTKLTALTADTTLATTDIFYYVADPGGAPASKKITVTNLITNLVGNTSMPFNARLTLETGVPTSIADQTAKTTLYLTPYNGNRIAVYSGTAWSVLALSADISITLASLTAGLPYDVYVYSNAGTLTLELTAWTNTTTRATALTTQDGIFVKTGVTTRRYVGTICIVATGQCEDSSARRMVWNYYNRVVRILTRINTTSHTYTTAAWRAWNNSAANSQVEFVLGEQQSLLGIYRAVTTGTGSPGVGFGIDTTGGPSGTKGEQFNNPAMDSASSDMFACAAGYHYWVGVETGGTTTTFERISMTMQLEG